MLATFLVHMEYELQGFYEESDMGDYREDIEESKDSAQYYALKELKNRINSTGDFLGKVFGYIEVPEDDDYIEEDDYSERVVGIEFENPLDKDGVEKILKDFQSYLKKFTYKDDFIVYGDRISGGYPSYDPPEYEEFDILVYVNFYIDEPDIKFTEYEYE